MSRNDFFHQVKLIRKKLYCDCGDDVYQGIPCRHILAIVVKNKGAQVENLSINERWQILYYNEEIEDNEPNSLPEEGAKEEARNNKYNFSYISS